MAFERITLASTDQPKPTTILSAFLRAQLTGSSADVAELLKIATPYKSEIEEMNGKLWAVPYIVAESVRRYPVSLPSGQHLEVPLFKPTLTLEETLGFMNAFVLTGYQTGEMPSDLELSLINIAVSNFFYPGLTQVAPAIATNWIRGTIAMGLYFRDIKGLSAPNNRKEPIKWV